MNDWVVRWWSFCTKIATFPLYAVIMCWSGEIALSLFSLHLFASHFQVYIHFIYTVCVLFSSSSTLLFSLFCRRILHSRNGCRCVCESVSHYSVRVCNVEKIALDKNNPLGHEIVISVDCTANTYIVHRTYLPLIWLNRKSLGTY